MALPAQQSRFTVPRWGLFSGIPAVDELFDQMSRMLTSAFPEAARITVHSWPPPVEVEDTEEAFVIDAHLPGVRPEDVHVDLQNNELRITGEYGSEKAEGATTDREGAQRAGRYGRFDYRVTLPSDVDADSAEADLDNGVLHLRLPKASQARIRIPVQRTGR